MLGKWVRQVSRAWQLVGLSSETSGCLSNTAVLTSLPKNTVHLLYDPSFLNSLARIVLDMLQAVNCLTRLHSAVYYYSWLSTCCTRICCILCIEEADAGGLDSVSTASILYEQIVLVS